MEDIWSTLRGHFEVDDGSLPDIFVENLTSDEVCSIYAWVCEKAGIYGEPTFWDETRLEDVPVKDAKNPARLVVDGKTCPFRHGLMELEINGVLIPQLTVRVNQDSVEFDYRMGAEWGPKQLEALFEFLILIERKARSAVVTHAHEGHDNRTVEFSEVFEEYKNRRRP